MCLQSIDFTNSSKDCIFIKYVIKYIKVINKIRMKNIFYMYHSTSIISIRHKTTIATSIDFKSAHKD